MYQIQQGKFPPEFRLSKLLQPDYFAPFLSNTLSPHLMLYSFCFVPSYHLVLMYCPKLSYHLVTMYCPEPSYHLVPSPHPTSHHFTMSPHPFILPYSSVTDASLLHQETIPYPLITPSEPHWAYTFDQAVLLALSDLSHTLGISVFHLSLLHSSGKSKCP